MKSLTIFAEPYCLMIKQAPAKRIKFRLTIVTRVGIIDFKQIRVN